MSSTIPLPPREQLHNRYCSNKTTSLVGRTTLPGLVVGRTPRNYKEFLGLFSNDSKLGAAVERGRSEAELCV